MELLFHAVIGGAIGGVIGGLLLRAIVSRWKRRRRRIDSSAFVYWIYLDFPQLMRFMKEKDSCLGPAKNHYFVIKDNPVYTYWEKVSMETDAVWGLLLEVRHETGRQPRYVECKKMVYDKNLRTHHPQQLMTRIDLPDVQLNTDESFIIPLATLKPHSSSDFARVRSKTSFMEAEEFEKLAIESGEQFPSKRFENIGDRLIPQTMSYIDNSYCDVRQFNFNNRVQTDRNIYAEACGGCCIPIGIFLLAVGVLLVERLS